MTFSEKQLADSVFAARREAALIADKEMARTRTHYLIYGGIALFLAAFSQVGFVFSEALGRYGYLPPMLAAWAPNLVFVGLGALLFLSLDS